MRCPRRHAAWLAVLPILTLVCFSRLAAAPGSLIVDARRSSVDHADRAHSRGLGNDLTSVFLPRFAYIVGHLRQNGRTPAWDASGFGGRPLVGNPQAGLYYPPVWLAWWSGRPASLGWLTVAHLLWAGLGVWVLSRSLGLSPLAAVVAGGCFQASPYLMAHTFEGHYPHIWSVAWYPWAFWSLGFLRKRHWGGGWILPVVLALAFLTGHPQEWYYLVVALTIWVVADAISSAWSGSARAGLTQIGVWGGLLVLSLGFCAIELLPELAAQPWLLKRGAIALGQVNRYQLHGENLLQLVNPFALGRPEAFAGHDNYWETVLSMGLAPLILALIGVAGFRDRGLVWRWGTVVLAALVFAAGRKLGLYRLAYAVLPGMERFRVPSRTLFLASLGASVLAGAGVEALLRPATSRLDGRKVLVRLRVGLLAIGLIAIVTCLVRASRGARPMTQEPATNLIFWASLVTSLGVISLGLRPGRAWGLRRRGLAWGLGAIALVELALYAQSLLVCAPVAPFLGDARLPEKVRCLKDERSGPLRIASVGTLVPDLGALSRAMEKTNVNDSFQIQHSADLYERLYPMLEPATVWRGGERAMDSAVAHHEGSIAQAVMNLMSVGFLVADRKRPLPSLKPIAAELATSLWRNTAVMPRAYVVPRAVEEASLKGERVGRRLLELDPRAAVLMNRDPLPKGEQQSYTPANWLSRDPDEVVLRVETRAPGLLVVGNTWMPGWSALVDATPAPVLRGNFWQQVVPIERPGRHEIVLRYEPPGFALGLAISALSLLGWCGMGLVALVRGVGWKRLTGQLTWNFWPAGAIRLKPSRDACG